MQSIDVAAVDNARAVQSVVNFGSVLADAAAAAVPVLTKQTTVASTAAATAPPAQQHEQGQRAVTAASAQW